MLIERVELRVIELPLLNPFETSFGVQTVKRCVIVRLDSEGIAGWGECVAMEGPSYSEETVGTAWLMLSEVLIPGILGGRFESGEELMASWSKVRGNNMAKAALENAFMDALARSGGQPLARTLGGSRGRIESGVSIGIQPSIPALLSVVERELRAGYRRIKLKIKPGTDVEIVRAVRSRFLEVPVMVDANSAYTLNDIEHLSGLDGYSLMMIEQPLGHDDIIDHAKLAHEINTLICLDESIRSSSDARKAIDIGACRIINIKNGRLGGLIESVRTHDVCVERNVPVWCGGMLETNIGRAHNVALNSLPGFTLPGDVAASARYFERDVAFPDFELNPDGTIVVPNAPGIGVQPDIARLDEVTLKRAEFRA